MPDRFFSIAMAAATWVTLVGGDPLLDPWAPQLIDPWGEPATAPIDPWEVDLPSTPANPAWLLNTA